MDLRGIANNASSVVNPNTLVTVKRSTGYTIGTGQRQIPTYAAPVTGPASIQALTADDVAQLDGMNIQGTVRAIFLTGSLAGVVRPNSAGGDIVTIAGKDWLVFKVFEAWPTWTKAAIVLQV